MAPLPLETDPALPKKLKELQQAAVRATAQAEKAKKKRKFWRCSTCGHKRAKVSHPYANFCPWHPKRLGPDEFYRDVQQGTDPVVAAEYNRPFYPGCRAQEGAGIGGCRRLEPGVQHTHDTQLKRWFCETVHKGSTFEKQKENLQKNTKRKNQMGKVNDKRMEKLRAPRNTTDLEAELPLRLRDLATKKIYEFSFSNEGPGRGELYQQEIDAKGGVGRIADGGKSTSAGGDVWRRRWVPQAGRS